MKKCPECGKTIFFDGAEKCTYCGHHFEVQKKITSSPGVRMLVKKNGSTRKPPEGGEVRISGNVRKAMQEADPHKEKTPSSGNGTQNPVTAGEGDAFSRYDQQLASLQKQISDSQAMSISLLTSLLAQQNAAKTVSQPQPEEKKPEKDIDAIIAEMEKRHQEELKKTAEEAKAAVDEARRRMEAESEARKAEEKQRIQEMVRQQFEEAQKTASFIERPEKTNSPEDEAPVDPAELFAGNATVPEEKDDESADGYDELSKLVSGNDDEPVKTPEEDKTDDGMFDPDSMFGDTFEQDTSFDDDDGFGRLIEGNADDEDEKPSEEDDEDTADSADDDSLWDNFDIEGEAVNDDGIVEEPEDQDDKEEDPDDAEGDGYDDEDEDDDEDDDEEEEKPKKKSRRQLRKERKEAKRKAKAESEEDEDEETDDDDYDDAEDEGSAKIDILFLVLSLFAPLGILLAIISAFMRKGERALVCLEGVILGVFITAVAILLNGGQVPSIFGLDKLVSSLTEAFFSMFG